jgi:hypothetical protein
MPAAQLVPDRRILLIALESNLLYDYNIMNNTTKDITEDEQQLRRIIREEVTAAIGQAFHDPDSGLSLNEETRKRLNAVRETNTNEYITLTEVEDKYS